MDLPSSLTAFLSTISTTEQAAECIEACELFLSQMYKTERKDITTTLDETLPERISKGIKEYLSTQKITITNQEEVRYAITTLIEALKEMRPLSFTLAHDPTQKTLTLYTAMAKQEFGQDVICDLTVNPEIIGGAIIIFDGKYIDQSVKKKLDILFEAKKSDILGILHYPQRM